MKKRKNEIREMGKKNYDGDGIDEVNWNETRRREVRLDKNEDKEK